MDINAICSASLFFMIFISICNAEGIHRTVDSRTFPAGTVMDVGSRFFESECSSSRTNFTMSAVVNFLRYNHDPSSGHSRTLQYWTDIAWPEVPAMEYMINGIKISDMEMKLFHFSVKHPAVDHVLSIFLVTFLHHNEFKFCVYFNENIGVVGFSFQDVVGASNFFRSVTRWPYLDEHEKAIQEKFLAQRWIGVK